MLRSNFKRRVTRKELPCLHYVSLNIEVVKIIVISEEHAASLFTVRGKSCPKALHER